MGFTVGNSIHCRYCPMRDGFNSSATPIWALTYLTHYPNKKWITTYFHQPWNLLLLAGFLTRLGDGWLRSLKDG